MPSQSNPAVGAAAGFASDASRNYEAGMDFVTRLRAAAQQQQQHDDQQRQQSFKDQLELSNQGYVPLTLPPTGGTIAKGGLGVRTRDNPDAQGLTGQVLTEPYTKTQYQKGSKLDDSNSLQLGGLADRFNQALGTQYKPESRVPHSTFSSLTEALKLAQPAAASQDIDTEHFSQPVIIDRKTGKATPIQLPDGVTHKDKAEKPDSRQLIDSQNYSSPMTYDKTTNQLTALPLPEGVKPQLSPAQQEAAARIQAAREDRKQARADALEVRAQAGRDAAQKLIDKYQKDEQEQHGIRTQYGELLGAKPGEVITDPVTKARVKIGDHPEQDVSRRKVWTQKYQTATDQVQRLQDTQKKLVTRMGGGDQPASAPAKPAASPAKAPPAKPGRPLTDPRIAARYLEKAGGNKQKARELAKAAGWDF